jgi:hypothetical protein
MSELKELWKSAKVGLEKTAGINALLPAVKNVGKLLPAVKAEAKAVQTGSKLLPATDELAAVSRNIDEAIPTMRSAKGRVVGSTPLGGERLKLPAPAAAAATKGRMGQAGDAVKGFWNGLGEGTRGGIKATGLLGAGALAGHADGKATGLEQGLSEGATKGFDAGLQAGAGQAAVDPGVLGRLLEVFTGRQPATINAADPEVAYRRQAALRRILAGQ